MATALEIHAIADQISAKGGTPTLAAVRAALGGGSFTTISEAMKQWKTARQASSVPMREAAPVAVAERMAEVGAEIWSIALGMANDRLASERDGLEQTRLEMEQSQAEAAELADQLAADLDAAKVQIAKDGDAIRNAETQAAQQLLEKDVMTEKIAVAKEVAHTAQAALAEAQKRADELAGLLKQERDARAAADLSKSSAVQLAAVTASELNAAERRGTEAEAREKVALSERIEAEKQAASARQAEQQARIAEQAAQARLEAAAREIEQAKKSIKEARDEAKASSEAAAELRGRLAAIDHVEQQKEENSLNKHQKVTQ